MTRPKYKGRESQFQKALVKFVRHQYPKVLFFHVDNGRAGMKPHQVKEFNLRGMLAGVPDLLFCEPRGGFTGLALELKVSGGSLTDNQARVQAVLRIKGWLTFTVWNLDDALDIVNAYLDPGQFSEGELLGNIKIKSAVLSDLIDRGELQVPDYQIGGLEIAGESYETDLVWTDLRTEARKAWRRFKDHETRLRNEVLNKS